MSFRYIGAILVFVSCGAAGFLKASGYRRQVRELEQLGHCLDLMLCELEYQLTPLPQICRNAANSASGCLGKIFANLSQELENQIAPDAASCMQAALAAVKDVPPQVEAVLNLLGNSLGKFDADGQISEISAVKRHCQELLSQMQENQTIRLRTYQTLGLCAGAALAIVFL